MFLSQRYELLVIDGTCSNQDHAIGGVVSLDVVRKVVALNGENVGFWSKYGSAKRLTWGKVSQKRERGHWKNANLGKRPSGGDRKLPLPTACRPPVAPSK